MDPFEEFEFKPITEGLGFHKKKSQNSGLNNTSSNKDTINLKDKNFKNDLTLDLTANLSRNSKIDLKVKESESLSTQLNQNKPQSALAQLAAKNSLKEQADKKDKKDFKSKSEPFFKTSNAHGLDIIDSNSDLLKSPLPRKESGSTLNKTTLDIPSPNAVDEILKTLKSKRNLDFENSKKIDAQKTQTTEYVLAKFSFAAGILDTMLVLAAGLLCMILLLIVTKADLIGTLSSADSDPMIIVATLSLFATVNFVYFVVNRAFLGFTPGEWAFDQRIGTPKDLESPVFLLKIIARSTLNIITGFILLPILSVLLNKDLGGLISGAQLYRKN